MEAEGQKKQKKQKKHKKKKRDKQVNNAKFTGLLPHPHRPHLELYDCDMWYSLAARNGRMPILIGQICR